MIFIATKLPGAFVIEPERFEDERGFLARAWTQREFEAQGVNLRRVFTEPQSTFDVIEWVQGTAATPYLEYGSVTKFAAPGTGMRLTGPFGGPPLP